MNAADHRRLTPALATLAVLLVLLLIALWLGLGRTARWHGTARAPKLPTAATIAPPVAPPPLQHFAAVWRHPLFSPGRVPGGAADSGSGSGELELTGVVMLPGLRMAIVHDKESGRDYRLVKGGSAHGGPTLIALHARSAIVDAGGSQVELKLVPGPAPGASAPDAVVPRAPATARMLQRIKARRPQNGQNGGG